MTEKDLTATDNPDGRKPGESSTGPAGGAAAGQDAAAEEPSRTGVTGTVSEPTANPVPPDVDATTDPDTHDSPQIPPDHGQDRR